MKNQSLAPHVILLGVTLVIFLGSAFSSKPLHATNDKPPIQLAKHYSGNINLAEYLVSEKYDGVRGYWNGTQLFTRSGIVIRAPAWFSKDFPSMPIEGELWIDRGQFEWVSGLVRQHKPNENDWRKVKFMLFDLPTSKEPFSVRLQQLNTVASQSVYLEVIEQQTVKNVEALYQLLDDVVALGGEGLMLHHKNALYQVGRVNHILKLKKKHDAEAVVIGYSEGKGKYKGMMGALKVKMPNEKVFEIGTGFTDKERQNPPPIGSVVTYQYLGFTKNGIPRFASFLRLRKNYQ
ncbi:DNA ligase [Shewanella gaetbuli]|uniref:DNA ligase n=1 Tax=Shewanella gaetbuli TaxID=220752 RepID=A0A9X1ZK52_9GAMM|nr:DNA ligase [Shewanella gaetbuli]MCL1143006.1 DNA ligase [Shewanella gaetbuli]